MAATLRLGRTITARKRDVATETALRQTLACNKNPRYSLAALLDAPTLARYQSKPGLPGRLPAPRAEFGCNLKVDLPANYPPLIANRPKQFSGIPDYDPQPNPPPSPPPIGVEPPTPTTPPSDSGPGPQPPGATPSPTPPPCGCGPSYRSQRSPTTLNFHLSGDSAGASPTTEVRISQRIARPYTITQITVLPISGVTSGQYLDILVSTDDDGDDTDAPTGSSIFDPQGALTLIPAEDRPRGLPVIALPYTAFKPVKVYDQNTTLKILSAFVAPAIDLPTLHVLITIEEYDELGMPPVDIRPAPEPPPPPGHAAPEALPGPRPQQILPSTPPTAQPPPPSPGGTFPWWELNNCIPLDLLAQSSGQGPSGTYCPGAAAPGYTTTGMIALPQPLYDYLTAVVIPKL